MQLYGLSQQTLERWLAARRSGGPFRSLAGFLQRVGPARDEAEHLIQGGALDALGGSRRGPVWRAVGAFSPPGDGSTACSLVASGATW